MSAYQFVALLIAAIGPILALARMVRAPDSLILFGAGVASAFVPGLPPAHVDPQLVLNLFLPPIIYASAVRVSWHLLRFTWVPGLVLGAALVLTTVVAVAIATRFWLLPGLSWTAAFFLGAVAAIFDTRLFHEAKGRPRVPRAIADVLKARELVVRPFILATFALTIESAGSAGLSPGALFEHYVFDIPAGIAVGLAIGAIVVFARRRIDPAPLEIAVSVATPYAAALSASALGVSGVGAITSAALVVSALRIDTRTGAPISSSEARVSATAFWEQVSLMLSSVLFFLAGRALPEALGAIENWPVWQLVAAALGLLAIVVAIQFAFAYPATGLAPIARALESPRGSSPRAGAAAIMAWSSTRSVVGLILALSIPPALADSRPFPERDLILVVAALTIVASVLIQGLTLRAAVTKASLCEEGEQQREKDEALRAIKLAARSPNPEHANGFDAARKTLLDLREQDRIGDEVLIGMLRETDLTSRADEGDALPGAGPPNP